MTWDGMTVPDPMPQDMAEEVATVERRPPDVTLVTRIGTIEVWECGRCAALHTDLDKHLDWHWEVEG